MEHAHNHSVKYWLSTSLMIITFQLVFVLMVPNTEAHTDSEMCSCFQPFRKGATSHQLKPIENLAGSKFKDCFKLHPAECTGTYLDEHFGIVLIIKKQHKAQPDSIVCNEFFTLDDVSVVMVNENGFPYGELELSREINACPKAPGAGNFDITSYTPVLNEAEEFIHECDKLNPASKYKTLYNRNPSWISLFPSLDNNPINDPTKTAFLYQFLLKNKVKTSSPNNIHPKKLQFIVELGINEGKPPNAKYTKYRMKSGIIQITSFSNADRVQLSPSSIVITPPDIPLDTDYIPNNRQCPVGPESPKEMTTRDPACHCFAQCGNVGEDCTSAKTIKADTCFEVVFQQDKTNKNEFFMSLQLKSPLCSTLSITSVQFIILQRTRAKGDIKEIGEWSDVGPNDFADQQKCKGRQHGGKLTPVLAAADSFLSCSSGQATSRETFWSSSVITKLDEVVCAKVIFPQSSWKVSEFQPGYKVHADEQNVKCKAFDHLAIYSMDASGPPANIQAIREQFSLTNIRRKKSFKVPCLESKKLRKTVMCCQEAQGLTIEEIDSTHSLDPCFKLEVAKCKDTHVSKDVLGAVFTQDITSANCKLKIADLRIILLNDVGYPYGELEPNRYATECIEDANFPDYAPVVNFLNGAAAKTQACTGFPDQAVKSKYGGVNPTWISLNVESIIPATGTSTSSNSPGPSKRVVGVRLKKKIKTQGQDPELLQFVAEFTVDSSGTPKVYRIRSQVLKLQFAANDQVDVPGSLAQAVSQGLTVIAPHPDFMMELTSPVCPPKLVPTWPGTDDTWGSCNCFDFEKQGQNLSPAQDKVEILNCISIVFSHNANSFYFGVTKLQTPKMPIRGNCNDYAVQGFVGSILERKQDGTVTTIQVGAWDNADVQSDFASGRCMDGTFTGTANPQKGGSKNVAPCPGRQGGKDLFYFYKPLIAAGDSGCGKWTVTGGTVWGEIQLLVEVDFQLDPQNNPNKNMYTLHRHPVMYRIDGTNVLQLTQLDHMNDRMYLYFPTKPVHPPQCIKKPFSPTSDICGCTPKRQGGFDQKPDSMVTDIDQVPNQIKNCFEFKMAGCTIEGKKFDTVGATLIIQPGTTAPCSDITVTDVAFMALNSKGYPFGEPTYKEFSRVCFQPADILKYEIRKLDHTKAIMPPCHAPNSADSTGKAWDNTHYLYGDASSKTPPSWLQVFLDVKIKEIKKPVAVQVPLKIPPANAKPEKVQFIAEMNLKDGQNNDLLVKMKTPVYTVTIVPGDKIFDADTLAEDSTALPTGIPRAEDWFETDASLSTCRISIPPVTPRDITKPQTCNLFEFNEPGGSNKELLPTDALFQQVDGCVTFGINTQKKDDGTGFDGIFFFLSVSAEKSNPKCQGGYQVIGMPVLLLKQSTPYIKQNPYFLQEGVPHGHWNRATLLAPGYPKTPPKYPMGEFCEKQLKTPPSQGQTQYTGGIRRLPIDFTQKCCIMKTNPQTEQTPQQEFLFMYYPLMNQPDDRNAFCAAVGIVPSQKINDPKYRRFEFQVITYVFINQTNQMSFMLKRSPVYEYFSEALKNPSPSGKPSEILFPDACEYVFPVQEPTHLLENCMVDVCIYEEQLDNSASSAQC